MINRLPAWFKQEIPDTLSLRERTSFFRGLNLNTVCESAHCPNISDCFKRQTATFMILGNVCTRKCRFCAVEKGEPLPVDSSEPENIVSAVRQLGLKYVVITAVTRDDLSDGGAGQFVLTVSKLREAFPEIKIELLIPDFQGKKEDLEKVTKCRPDVSGHNLETVARLYDVVRPQADYLRSLDLLSQIKRTNNSILTKSGIMVGLGEKREEIIKTMQDLRKVNCDILTIGQYLAPSSEHLPVVRFLSQKEFSDLGNLALTMGFKQACCAPKVRSSYHSEEVFAKCMI